MFKFKDYLDERTLKNRSSEFSAGPVPSNRKDARYLWGCLRGIFISMHEMCSDNTITIYLTYLDDGHFYYCTNSFYQKLDERSFEFSKDTMDILLQLAVDEGITVNLLKGRNVSLSRHSWNLTNMDVYTFTYTPPAIK